MKKAVSIFAVLMVLMLLMACKPSTPGGIDSLSAGKWVKLHGWGDTDAAKQEITESVARYQSK